MRGLLVTVGIGTNVGFGVPPVIDALGRSVAELRPEVLALLTTQESAQYRDHIARQGGLRDGATNHREAGPDDLEGCFRSSLSLLDWLESRGLAPSDIAVDVTSGTAAMRVGAALAAVTRRIPRYRVIAGEREGGLVRSGAEQFLEFEPLAVFAEADVELARELIRRYRFTSARRVLQRGRGARVGKRSRRVADVLDKVASAYQAWDLFDHAAGLRNYAAAERAGELGEFALPDRSRKALGALAAERASALGVADLVANAERREEEGRLDDAAARLYRAVELCAQLALRSCGLDAGDLDIDRISDPDLRARLASAGRPDHEGRLRVRVGLVNSLLVLRDLGHPLGESVDPRDQGFQSALEARNLSILAHGTRPVGPPDLRRLREWVDRAATILDARFEELLADVRFPWSPGGRGDGVGGSV